MLAFSLNSFGQNYIGIQGSSASGDIYHTGGNLGIGISREVVTVKLDTNDLTSDTTFFVSDAINVDDETEFELQNQIDKTIISIFPNPTKGEVTITSTSQTGNAHKITNIEVFDLSGKTILYSSLLSSSTKIDLSSFASGTYIVKIQTENYTYQQKIIKN